MPVTRAELRAENEKLQAEVQRLRMLEKRVSPATEPCQCPEFCTYHARANFDAMKLQFDELKKEALFRIDLAELWVAQLRKALGKAMDALARDPKHDTALQAELEMTRMAVAVDAVVIEHCQRKACGYPAVDPCECPCERCKPEKRDQKCPKCGGGHLPALTCQERNNVYER